MTDNEELKEVLTLAAMGRGYSPDDPRSIEVQAVNAIEKAEQERDHLKTQKDILWQGLNDAKERITRSEQERDAAVAEMHARELHHFEEEQKSAAAHAVIAEAKAMLASGVDDHDGRAYAILSAVDTSVLREHDKRVKAEALREAAFWVPSVKGSVWLRERADQIANSEQAARRIEGNKTDDHE